MSGFPWPLDGVQHWFEGLWSWIGTAAYNAVGQVYGWVSSAVSGLSSTITNWFNQIWTWISNAVNTAKNVIVGTVNSVSGWISSAVSGLWSNISSFFSNLWNSISSGFGAVTTYISGAFSNLGSLVSNALTQAYTGLTGVVTNVWGSLSSAISGVGNTLLGGITSLGGAVSSGLGGLWGNISGFFANIANGISSGIGAVGTAVSSGFSGISDMFSGLLSGFASAMGTALQSAVTGVTSTLTVVVPQVLQFINQNFITPLLSAVDWVLTFVSGLFSSFYNSLVNTLRGMGMGTPEGAVVLSVPLLLTSISAVFVMGSLGAVGDIKIMGCGIQLSSLTNQLVAAFGITHLASAVISPILSAAYSQPVKYYWDSIFRPNIVSTGQADQMLFEENITEAQWHQVYAYRGWKEEDITAWGKTMWREPSALILRGMATDPGADLVWVRKKLRENGFIGEDADAILAYGKRMALKDERTALATQVELDYRGNVIQQAEAEADLTALKFLPEEIVFKIQKVQFLIARDARAAALKADAVPVSTQKSLTEAEVTQEFKLGLATPAQYIQNLRDLKYSASAAQRKYAIQVTPKPLTTAEKTAQIDDLNSRIAKVKRRYAILLAREDLNVTFYVDMAEYLSSLEKPPELRIVTLQEQITKTAGEKQLIMQQEQNELDDLQGQIEVLGVAG